MCPCSYLPLLLATTQRIFFQWVDAVRWWEPVYTLWATAQIYTLTTTTTYYLLHYYLVFVSWPSFLELLQDGWVCRSEPLEQQEQAFRGQMPFLSPSKKYAVNALTTNTEWARQQIILNISVNTQQAALETVFLRQSLDWLWQTWSKQLIW